MIITQTPIRISFLGGGTDFPQYFLKEEGWVISSVIDRYLYVCIKSRFDRKIRVGYTQTELVDSIDQLQHELVREALRKTGILESVEITTMGDIPSEGSGMGSSSAVTVGLLNAMYHYIGEPKEPEKLAREACEIEIDILGKPIGMQDQYIAAYGGQRFIRFGLDGRVEAESLALCEDQRLALNRNLLLFFTNVERKAETILKEQVKNIDGKLQILREMKKLAILARNALNEKEFDEFGLLLHKGWEFKKQMASCISNSEIDRVYEEALKAGALGGKIPGAGGGGFLLLYCPLDRQDAVRNAMKGFQELPFNLERDGTKVLFNYRRY